MNMHTNENTPAHPIAIPPTPNLEYSRGFTAREHAAIQLRVPMSGNPWLDAMITEARRWDAAQAALVGSFNARGPKESVAHEARQQAYTLTRQMKGGAL